MPSIVPIPNDIVHIAVGRTACLALATNGELYFVQDNFKSALRLEFSIPGQDPKINTKDHPVLHLATGWDCAATVLKGLGLVVWQEGEEWPDKHDELRPAKLIKSEYSIVGLMAGWGYLVFLTEEGSVYRVDGLFTNSELSPILLKKFVGSEKFTSISGNLSQFGVFNSAGEVFIGNDRTRMNDLPLILPGLQRKGIVNISWGDWHALALLEDGSVLSWGKELRANGCLGLGYSDLAMAKSMDLEVENEFRPKSEGGYDIVTNEPRKVAFGESEFVLGIAAGGWHSGALVVDSKQVDFR